MCIQLPYAAITFNKLEGFFYVPFTWKIHGRQRRVSFLRGGHDRKKNVLEFLHSDVFGPVNIKS